MSGLRTEVPDLGASVFSFAFITACWEESFHEKRSVGRLDSWTTRTLVVVVAAVVESGALVSRTKAVETADS